MKKMYLVLAALVLTTAISITAYTQLAGTQRLTDNFWFIGDKAIKFGATPNASIQYTGGNLVIDVTSGGGKVSLPDGIDLGSGSLSFGASAIFEGTTADAFETTLTVVDPTADRTVSIPDASGTIFMSTAAQTAADSIRGVASGIEFEGATADAFETTLTLADPTADRSIALPDATGTVILSSGAIDVANSISGTNNAFIFEGTTADAFETTISVTDPTADRAVVVPNAGGTVLLGGNTSVAAGANTACNTTCGAATRCIGGWDAGVPTIVDCADATADKCFCSAN